MKETAKYRITGLVDIFDEQGVITGQYPIGSVQELDVEVGIKAVEEGTAEAIALEEGTENADGEPDPATSEAGEGSTGEAEAPTGEIGSADNDSSGSESAPENDEKTDEEVE